MQRDMLSADFELTPLLSLFVKTQVAFIKAGLLGVV